MVDITNKTAELADCAAAWFFDRKYNVWCLEDILYTMKAQTPKYQRLSIYVPKAYMSEGGKLIESGACGKYTASTAPIVFANNAAGYMQMPHTWLGGPRDDSAPILAEGMIYVTVGSRGRESVDAEGRKNGKSPITLVDLKTAIRFLRHNRESIPGNTERIISVGTSAGGAMSTLLAVTGDNEKYMPYLKKNGAFMEESDAVYASQIYCPIIDLEHADLAYEWQFVNDTEYQDSPVAPAGKMNDFEKALSKKLSEEYIRYFNSLGLKDPKTGNDLTLNADGRSGSGYAYLMGKLEESLNQYLERISAGKVTGIASIEDYIAGKYTEYTPMRLERAGDGEDAGSASLEEQRARVQLSTGGLGEIVARAPKAEREERREMHDEPPMQETEGDDKYAWMKYEERKASICDLDTYLLHHRRRMKPCTSFDGLWNNTGENHEFGSNEEDFVHFNPIIGRAVASLKDEFPEEAKYFASEYSKIDEDAELQKRIYLLNPMHFIGTEEESRQPEFYRINVGSRDADTAFTISMALALKLLEAGKNVKFQYIWDQPHCPADFEGEFTEWIKSIV